MERSRGHHFDALRRRVAHLSDRIEAEEKRELEPPCEICEEPQDYRLDLSYDRQEKTAWIWFRDQYLTLSHDLEALEAEYQAMTEEAVPA